MPNAIKQKRILLFLQQLRAQTSSLQVIYFTVNEITSNCSNNGKVPLSIKKKKDSGNEFGTEALWCLDSPTVMATKVILLQWGKKKVQELFLVDVYVKILSIYFSILAPSHPMQS